MISLKNSIYNVFSKERSEESYAFNFYSMEEQYITENDFINEEERREQINEIKKILHVLTPRQREIIYQSAYNLLQRSLQKVRDTFGTPECIAWISILTTFFRETQKMHFL